MPPVSSITARVQRMLNDLVSFPSKQEFLFGDVLNYILTSISGIFVTLTFQQAEIDAISGNTGLTAAQHKTVRQAIHLADNEGPMDGFPTAFKELLPNNSMFPTSLIWYDKANPLTRKKIVEEQIAYNGSFITTDRFLIYDTDGVTIVETLTDSYDYTSSLITPKVNRTSSN